MDVKTMKNSIWRTATKYIPALLIPVVLFVLLMVLVPQKVSATNIPFIIIQSILPAVVAWGVCFGMTIGITDFAIGAYVLISAIVGGNLAQLFGVGVFGVIFFCTVVGLLCGCFTGTLYSLMKVPALVVSIGVMLILESLGSLVFGGGGIHLSQHYIVFGNSIRTVIFGVICFAAAYIIFTYMPFGYHVRAIGKGPSIARTLGLKVERTKFFTFVLAGIFAGLYAALSLCSTSVVRPINSIMGSMKITFDAIMCIFIGRALGGEINLMISVVIGSLVMQIVQLGLTAVNSPSTYTQAIVALVVLIAMCYSSARKKHVENKARKLEVEAGQQAS